MCPILVSVPKNDEKNNLVHKGVIENKNLQICLTNAQEDTCVLFDEKNEILTLF